MNLYAIKFTHYSQKDNETGIITYAIAKNDEQVYEWIKSEPRDEDWSVYNSWKYNEEDGIEYDLYDEKINYVGKISFKDYIISIGGEMHSEYANYDDLYYGKTYYGWDLINENIQDYQVDALTETIGLVDIGGYFK